MSSSSYTDIFSTSSTRTTPTVRVDREDYWGTICPSSYVPTNLNFSLFSYSYGLLNVSFWYGCSGSIAVTHACNSSFTVTYLIQTRASDLATVPVTAGACQYNILVPVFESVSEALDSNTTDIETAIDGGFELDVQNNDTDLCNNCVASGGACGQKSTSAQFICFCLYSSSPTTCSGNSSPLPSLSGSTSHGRMTRIIVKMTNSLEDQIGKGGYGTVYKGKLPDGPLVAVKILNESTGDGEEFINEVASIGRTSHVNVVTLVGFCYQKNKRALIYEYMPNGSLDKSIHNQGF
ncbi:hypothetical protein ACLB2K_058957 [Fragaria x ananassa]